MDRNGPSEFEITGPFKDWSIVPKLKTIRVPVLLLNGRYDQAQDSVVGPFFSEIPKVKWVQFADLSHMPYWEERERFIQVVRDFLGV